MDEYKDPRWQRLRLERMQRDAFACVGCKDDKSTLHVHHIRYCGELWDTPISDLQTLCEKCHAELGPHPKGGLFWVNIDSDRALVVEHCPACKSEELSESEACVSCLQCGWRPFVECAVGFRPFKWWFPRAE